MSRDRDLNLQKPLLFVNVWAKNLKNKLQFEFQKSEAKILKNKTQFLFQKLKARILKKKIFFILCKNCLTKTNFLCIIVFVGWEN